VLPGRVSLDALGAEVEEIAGHPSQPGVVVALAPIAGRERGVLARRQDEVHA
jgi:hypothetical protein